MIQTIIDDAKAMENEAIVAEEDAPKDYENVVRRCIDYVMLATLAFARSSRWLTTWLIF